MSKAVTDQDLEQSHEEFIAELAVIFDLLAKYDYQDKMKAMSNLTFITGNEGKAKYLGDYFHLPVAHTKLDLKEIQSLDLEEVVKDKAKRAYEIVKSPVLVEDVSLVFKGMKSLPGPLIKWFLETLDNEGLCRLVDGLDTRDALAEVQFAICDESGVRIFSGSMEGIIANAPKGEMGFGWDPIFIPKGHEKTWAEMNDDEKHNTSMRKIALEKMFEYLKK
ncbi:MAG: non-canonical purine pyrophosphatase [Parcubacteria group bacterium]|nr:non-canonical purine pyrophosphatase [Parcubacteria group bacterium]